ncbi:hypothetical protein PanWU01x14_094390, partial [Parasponia andersonii]
MFLSISEDKTAKEFQGSFIHCFQAERNQYLQGREKSLRELEMTSPALFEAIEGLRFAVVHYRKTMLFQLESGKLKQDKH